MSVELHYTSQIFESKFLVNIFSQNFDTTFSVKILKHKMCSEIHNISTIFQ